MHQVSAHTEERAGSCGEDERTSGTASTSAGSPIGSIAAVARAVAARCGLTALGKRRHSSGDSNVISSRIGLAAGNASNGGGLSSTARAGEEEAETGGVPRYCRMWTD